MNLGNTYSNLPGMLVDFKDGGKAFRFNNVETGTDSMLILGTSTDGPVFEPTAVDEGTAELIFGNDFKKNGAPNGSTLIHAFKEALEIGCQDIRLMRISGSVAKTLIGAEHENITTNDRKDEDLGVIQGNNVTKLVLDGEAINTSTIRLFAKGEELPTSSFAVTTETEEVGPARGKRAEAVTKTVITIKKNACDAGIGVTVRYVNTVSIQVTEKLFTVNQKRQIVLPKAPKNGTVRVMTIEGTNLVINTDFTVALKVITLSEAQIALVGQSLKVSFEYDNPTNQGVETGNAGNPFVTETSPQVVKLAGDPMENSVIVYVDGARVLDTDAYAVNEATDTVCIVKSKFHYGQQLSISYYVRQDVVVKKDIIVESVFGGGVYNTGSVEIIAMTDAANEVIGKKVIITKPESKAGLGELPQSYSSFDYPTFGALVDAINSNNGVYVATTMTPEVLSNEMQVTHTYFSEGDDGLNLTKDQLFEALSGKRDLDNYITEEGAYQLLENYLVDFVVPVGVYADDLLADKYQNFAYELAMFCAVVSNKNKTTYGAISMKPCRDVSLKGKQDHAKYLAGYVNDYYMRAADGSFFKDNSTGNNLDLGKFISVCCGPSPIIKHEIKALRKGDPSIAYIALNTIILPQSAPTNKKIPGTLGIEYTLSNSQLNEITGNRMVAFGTKYARNGEMVEGCYVVDGPTAAQPSSEYTRLSTCKVICEVVDQVREVSEPFIGEPNSIEQRNALSAAISKRIGLLIENRVIIDADFILVATPQDQVLGQANLELGILAPLELRKINTIVGFKR